MNLQKTLKYLVYVAAFMPLIIFSQYVSPFHFGKVVFFRSLVEIMAALYIVLIMRQPEYRPRFDKYFWAFFGFVLAFTVTTIFSVNPYISFWGTLERMGGLYSFWHYFVFYIIAVSVLRTKEDWLNFLRLSIIVAVISAVYGLGQRTDFSAFIGSGNRSRIFGTIGNPALFAGYEIFSVFLAVILGFAYFPKNRRWYLIAALLMSMAVFMTAVRGSIAGLVVGMVLFVGLYFYETHSKLARKVLLGLVGVVAVFIVTAFALRNASLIKDSGYLNRITDFSTSSYTVQTRFWAWEAGLKGWKESPKKILFGWGPENFNIPFSKYFNPKFFNGPGSETLFDRAHNMFVEILVTMGLLGELAYLFLFWTIFRGLWRLRKQSEMRVPAFGLMGMTLAYIIHNSFIFDTSANFLVFFSILGFMSWLSQVNQPQTEAGKPIQSQGLVTSVAVILSIGAIFLAYTTNIRTTEANFASTRGIVESSNNAFADMVTAYTKATSFNGEGRYEYRNSFAQSLINMSDSLDVSKPDVQAAFKQAISLEEKNAAENPEDYLPELYLSRLDIILGKVSSSSPYNDDALKHSFKALSYSKTFVRTYYEIAQGYLNKADYADALTYFRQAAQLNPDVGLSYWYVGAVEMEAGQTAQGLADMKMAIKKGYIASENDYLNLANVYIKANDFPDLVTTYEGLVKVAPNKAQYWASLAVAYARVGRIDDAVNAAHQAAQVDPSFTNDAKSFVQQLGRQW